MAGDGRQRGTEIGGRLGLVGGGERDEEPVVDLGVEDGDADAVVGEHVAVGVREPADQAVEAEAARVAPAALDLPQLPGCCTCPWAWCAPWNGRTGSTPFRPAGSAGGRFPLEVYIAVPDGVPLPPGVHWYDPLEHALVRVGPAPRGSALRWSSPVCRGVPAGVTANAAGGMCTGMPARCWANCWRWPAPLAWLPPCIRVSRRGGGRADWGGPGSRAAGGGGGPGGGRSRAGGG